MIIDVVNCNKNVRTRSHTHTHMQRFWLLLLLKPIDALCLCPENVCFSVFATSKRTAIPYHTHTHTHSFCTPFAHWRYLFNTSQLIYYARVCAAWHCLLFLRFMMEYESSWTKKINGFLFVGPRIREKKGFPRCPMRSTAQAIVWDYVVFTHSGACHHRSHWWRSHAICDLSPAAAAAAQLSHIIVFERMINSRCPFRCDILDTSIYSFALRLSFSQTLKILLIAGVAGASDQRRTALSMRACDPSNSLCYRRSWDQAKWHSPTLIPSVTMMTTNARTHTQPPQKLKRQNTKQRWVSCLHLY